MTNQEFKIAVLPGDGIGPEVMARLPRGAGALAAERPAAFGSTIRDTAGRAPRSIATPARRSPPRTSEAAAADAILLGAMGLPDVRYPDGTEIAPQLDLRASSGSMPASGPIRCCPECDRRRWPIRARATIDLVLVRESTEGLFASRGKGTVDGRRARATRW